MTSQQNVNHKTLTPPKQPRSNKEDQFYIEIKQIGKYNIINELGSGAFGKVFSARHILTNELVAIKILDKLALTKTPEDFELAQQELEILKIVRHKNIVQLYEIIETERYIFIVMEYCDGKDFMDYIIKKSKLSEMESLKFFQELINALFYLHSQNIAHRDIKIDNMLLDKNKNLKLIDFGLSTKYSDDDFLSQPCGTVVYAAPELLSNKDYHGMLADVWSSGIVLYGMLSGYLPFSDPDDEVNKNNVIHGTIEYPSHFSKLSKDLLIHMLDKDPMTRYTLQDIKNHPWFKSKDYFIFPGIIIGENRIPIDEQILDMIEGFEIDKEKVRISLLKNEYNSNTALYYLLIRQLKSLGYESVSDLSTKKFVEFILKEENWINKDSENEKKNENYDKNIENKKTKGNDNLVHSVTKENTKVSSLSTINKITNSTLDNEIGGKSERKKKERKNLSLDKNVNSTKNRNQNISKNVNNSNAVEKTKKKIEKKEYSSNRQSKVKNNLNVNIYKDTGKENIDSYSISSNIQNLNNGDTTYNNSLKEEYNYNNEPKNSSQKKYANYSKKKENKNIKINKNINNNKELKKSNNEENLKINIDKSKNNEEKTTKNSFNKEENENIKNHTVLAKVPENEVKDSNNQKKEENTKNHLNSEDINKVDKVEKKFIQSNQKETNKSKNVSIPKIIIKKGGHKKNYHSLDLTSVQNKLFDISSKKFQKAKPKIIKTKKRVFLDPPKNTNLKKKQKYYQTNAKNNSPTRSKVDISIVTNSIGNETERGRKKIDKYSIEGSLITDSKKNQKNNNENSNKNKEKSEKRKRNIYYSTEKGEPSKRHKIKIPALKWKLHSENLPELDTKDLNSNRFRNTYETSKPIKRNKRHIIRTNFYDHSNYFSNQKKGKHYRNISLPQIYCNFLEVDYKNEKNITITPYNHAIEFEKGNYGSRKYTKCSPAPVLSSSRKNSNQVTQKKQKFINYNINNTNFSILEKKTLHTNYNNYALINDQDLNIYSGPIDFSCICEENISLRELMISIKKKLNENNITYLQMKNNKLKCTKNGANLDIEIVKIIYNSNKCILYKKFIWKGGPLEYFRELSQLID